MATPTPPKSLLNSIENSKAEYVQLGKSGLRVSIPILGAMSIGHPEWAPWVIDEEKVGSFILSALFPLLCRLIDLNGAVLNKLLTTRLIVFPSPQSRLRQGTEHMGYGECIFQRSKRGDYWQGNQEIQYPAPQIGYPDEVQWCCGRGARCARDFLSR